MGIPRKLTAMKTALVLLAVIALAAAQVSKMSIVDTMIATGKDGCLVCVDDIVKAVADCKDENVNLLTCITEAVGAASDCIHCVCEVLEIIGGYDDVCP